MLQVHVHQLHHVQKGCLTRLDPELKSDGSRIESFNRRLGAIMKSHPCSLEVILTLVHDHILRRNIRLAMRADPKDRTPFISSTFGSHHLSLVDFIARRWNEVQAIFAAKSRNGNRGLLRLPEFEEVPSREMFGLAFSYNNASFGGKLDVKKEEEDKEDRIVPSNVPSESLHQPSSQEWLLRDLGIDPALVLLPEPHHPFKNGQLNTRPPVEVGGERSADTSQGEASATVVGEGNGGPRSVTLPRWIEFESAMPETPGLDHSEPRNSPPDISTEVPLPHQPASTMAEAPPRLQVQIIVSRISR